MRLINIVHRAVSSMLILSGCFIIYGQGVKITGTITDMSGNPIGDAIVSLQNISSLSTVSESDGTFLLEQSSGVIQTSDKNHQSTFFINGKGVLLNQEKESPVSIKLFDLKGSVLSQLTGGVLRPGTHFFSIEDKISCMPVIVQVMRNGIARNILYMPGLNICGSTDFASWDKQNQVSTSAWQQFRAVDVVVVTKTGFIFKEVPIDTYTVNLTIQLEKAADPVMIPNYEPDYWNSDWFINDCNNCYNYSNNRRTNTFAQPGRASGNRYSSNSCENISAAALRDGLETCVSLAEPIPPGKARIALSVNPGSDYHWYREDRNMMWSHKPGKGNARNIDNSGELISDPEKADRGGYTDFCGYFFIDSDSIQGGGHEHIRKAATHENTQPPAGKLGISFMLYSGREDPSFYLNDDATINKLLSLLKNTEPIADYPKESVEPLILGYRGILIEILTSKKTERYIVYNNLVEHGYIESSKGIKSFHQDNSGSIHQWLLDAALSGDVITDEEYQCMFWNNSSVGTVTDNDGNVYQTVIIGGQEWTAEHLRTTTFNDGSEIPQITDAGKWSSCTTPAFCFYDNTTDADEMKTYGALYNWYAVDTKKLAPAGWHVPTESDWNTLLNYLIDNGYNYDGSTTGNRVGKSLASQNYWDSNGDHYEGSIGLDRSNNNRSGFKAHPGAYRHNNGKFLGRKYQGLWCDMWSTAELNKTNAWSRNLAHTANDLIKLDYNKGNGFSVRLVKD